MGFRVNKIERHSLASFILITKHKPSFAENRENSFSPGNIHTKRNSGTNGTATDIEWHSLLSFIKPA